MYDLIVPMRKLLSPKPLFVVMSFLFVALIALFVCFFFIIPKVPPYTGPVDHVTVGEEVEYGTLFAIAKEQGFFAQNGLDVTLKEYASGAPAFADLLQGKIDMTDAADFVGVTNSFSSKNFTILGSVGTTTDAWEIISRTDHGIKTISDLRGKKIGVPPGTLGEFFLGNFLILNQIARSDIQLVYLSPQDLAAALQSGDIDSVMIFQPYAFNLRQQLGARVIEFPGQSDRLNYIVLYATDDLVKKRPDVAKRFVRSLVEAQQFLQSNPTILSGFMKRHFGYTDSYINSVITTFSFYVGLEQPMVSLMEDEAQWAIDNKVAAAKNTTRIPNYLNFIYFDALDSANTNAITIIR